MAGVKKTTLLLHATYPPQAKLACWLGERVFICATSSMRSPASAVEIVMTCVDCVVCMRRLPGRESASLRPDDEWTLLVAWIDETEMPRLAARLDTYRLRAAAERGGSAVKVKPA